MREGRLDFSPLPTLAQLGVKLIPTGADTWRCACPVHGGDRPSMAIRRRDGRWRLTCFACGFGGTAIGLVMALEDCDARTAVKRLGGSQEAAPVAIHRRPGLAVCCDACGRRFEVEGRTYKVPGTHGPLWETTAIEEAYIGAFRRGWRLDADGHCACARCRMKQPQRAARAA